MSKIDKKIEEFFNDNPLVDSGHYAKEDTDFIFFKRQDALAHAKSINSDHPEVVTFTRPVELNIESLTNAVNAGENQLSSTEVKKVVEKVLVDGAKDLASENSADAKPKLSVAEYKELKDKATTEYKELFGADPDSKLSGAKIQELNDAKKAELANEKN